MTKVLKIRNVISSLLDTVQQRNYYESAPDGVAYPFLVYDLPDSTDDGSMENFVLEIDGWDSPSNGDTTELETLMGEMDKLIHRKTTMIDGISLTFYRESRSPIKDPDTRLRRRQYTYQVRVHGE